MFKTIMGMIFLRAVWFVALLIIGYIVWLYLPDTAEHLARTLNAFDAARTP